MNEHFLGLKVRNDLAMGKRDVHSAFKMHLYTQIRISNDLYAISYPPLRLNIVDDFVKKFKVVWLDDIV